MVTLNFGLEDFKVKAENYNGADEKSQYGHYVNIFTNIGGYLSMAIFEDLRIGNLIEFDRTTFNYDFNQNKEILLSDIFEDGVDISNVIKSYIKENMKQIPKGYIETSGMFSVPKMKHYHIPTKC